MKHPGEMHYLLLPTTVICFLCSAASIRSREGKVNVWADNVRSHPSSTLGLVCQGACGSDHRRQ